MRSARSVGRRGGFSLVSGSGKQNLALKLLQQSSSLGSVPKIRHPLVGFRHFLRLLRVSLFFVATMMAGPKVEMIVGIPALASCPFQTECNFTCFILSDENDLWPLLVTE